MNVSSSAFPELDLAAARQRIAAAYAGSTFHDLGTRLVETLSEHLDRVEQREGPVLPWKPPQVNIPDAASYLREGDATVSGSELAERFTSLIATMLSRGNNLQHPRYIGHQVPGSVPLAALFDAVGAVTNQVMAIYEMGPWATAAERAVIDAWGTRIGLPAGEFGGLVTHGGSLANLTALLTARNATFPTSWTEGVQTLPNQVLLLAHRDVHYGITRAAGMLGIGTNQVLSVGLDERRRMDPKQLDDLLTRVQSQGQKVMAVVACACATPIGAFDPLDAIADVCERHNVWLHVDAAHGGAVAFSERHRSLIEGLARADSFVCDAHKTLFVPALCAFVFYRRKTDRYVAFSQDAPYLFDPTAPGMAEYDNGLVTVECTKRAAAFGLWGLWSLLGTQLFSDMVDVTFATARTLYDKLVAADDFEPLHCPECNIVVFRHLPAHLRHAPADRIGAFNQQIRRRLIESGEFYIVQTTLDGVPALRATVMNPLTTSDDLDALLTAIRAQGTQILADTPIAST